jgi:hypothetical protein
MGLCDEVRRHSAEVAANAHWVAIDLDAAEGIEPGPEPALDPATHYVEGEPEDVAAFLLALDAINFGSGWSPTLRKPPGRSGYFTVASALAGRFRRAGPWSPAELRELDAAAVAGVLGQEPEHELMALYARALNDLGAFLGDRGALDVVGEAGGSAERLAEQVAAGMPFFDDPGFYKRAQILPHDLALAGVAEFSDVDRLTAFADNLVPHVLRGEGVLDYDAALALRIDGGELLEPGSREEVEIRACAVHACEQIAERMGVPPRILDAWLWDRGQQLRYKLRPRHRARCVWY